MINENDLAAIIKHSCSIHGNETHFQILLKTAIYVVVYRATFFDISGKLFGFVDSTKNRDILNVGLLVVSTTNGKRYFRFDGGLYLNYKNPKFVECEVMSCFFSEIEHDSNNHASTEIS